MTWSLSVDPAARPWVPSAADLAKLRAAYPLPGVEVHLVPRPRDEATPYAYRAVSRGTTTTIFADPTETPRSLAWLLAHELGHHLVARRGFHDLLATASPVDLPRAGDRFHQVDPEERLVDGWATRLLGTRFDRDWWRARVRGRGSTSALSPGAQGAQGVSARSSPDLHRPWLFGAGGPG